MNILISKLCDQSLFFVAFFESSEFSVSDLLFCSQTPMSGRGKLRWTGAG